MKQKLFLAVAVLLLLGLTGWMLRDLFSSREQEKTNPYDYGMAELRKADTGVTYQETGPLKPRLPEITCLATDPAGRIYVAGNGGVEVYDATGRIMNRFSFPGTATCITLMPDGNLLLGLEDHLEIWSPTGILLNAWPPADSASVITSVAAGVAFVYAADAGVKTVYRYTRDGTLLSRIGEKDPERKIPGFVVPSPYFDVAVTAADEVWVANTGRHTLEKYTPEGDLLTSWGEASMTTEGFTGCCNPSHVALLPDGSFVTSEKGIERVKIYSPSGVFMALVAGPESFDEGTRGLDLATAPGGKIIVLDPARHRVRIFVPQERSEP
jgi:hypothetical protein